MIEYPMPGGGAPPDLFKGFREELGNIEKKREDKEAKAFEMASMIEMADQSTMFGGDYSEAQQMAQWMTEHLDDFTDSKEGMIEFQQMAQELTNFIDVSEAYKSQNFGTAQGGPKQGTFTGYSGRKAAGLNPYEKEGFIDTRSNEDYEASYLSLSQNRNLDFNEQGRPVLSQRGRVENPFMPRLEEVAFEGGFEWFEENAKGHKFPDGKSDALDWAIAKVENNDNLKRRIVKDWKVKSENKTDLEELLNDTKFVDKAKEEFLSGVERSFNSHSSVPKDDTKSFEQRFGELVVGNYTPSDIPSGVSGSGREGQPPLTAGLTAATLEVPEVSVGFNSMYELKNPIKTLSLGLGENASILGFNVDPYGQVYVTVKKPNVEPVGSSGNISLTETDKPDAPKFQYETILASKNVLSALRSRGVDDEIIQELMARSKEAVENTYEGGGMVSELETPKKSFIGSVLDRFSSGRFRRE